MLGHAPPTLVVDASTLINLYATSRLREIALDLPHTIFVSRCVLERENLYVRVQEAAGTISNRHIELTALITDGLIQLVETSGEAEAQLLIELATELGDGEAQTAAIAIHRGYIVATDDRKARRLLAEHWPGVRVLTTTEILRIWSESSTITPQELRDAFTAIQTGACFIPPTNDPEYNWWQSLMRE